MFVLEIGIKELSTTFLILSFFFIKEKTGFNFNLPRFNGAEFQKNNTEEDIVKAPEEIIKPEKKEQETAAIYLLALNSNGNGIYNKSFRNIIQLKEKSNERIQY